MEIEQNRRETTDNLSFSPDTLEGLNYIGGCDLSFFTDGTERAIACVVILDYPSFKVIHKQCSGIIDLSHQPYVSGFLALRFVSFLIKKGKRLL